MLSDGDNLESAIKLNLKKMSHHHEMDALPYSPHPAADKMISRSRNPRALLKDEKHNVLEVEEEEFDFDKNEESVIWKAGFQTKRMHDGRPPGPCLMPNGMQTEEGYGDCLNEFESVILVDDTVDCRSLCNMKGQGDRYDEPSVTLCHSSLGSYIRDICQSSRSSTESLAFTGEELHTSQSSVDDCACNIRLLEQSEGVTSVEVEIGMQRPQKEFQLDPSIIVENIEEKHLLTEFNDDSSQTDDTITNVNEKSTSHEFSLEKDSPGTDIIHLKQIDMLLNEAKYCKEFTEAGIKNLHLLRFKAEQEEAEAQHAKIEAEKGASEILLKVEELKTQLSCQRAENELRAAEIYGEKYLLMMEARELKLRLLETKTHQTRVLATINDIREILEERLERASQAKSAAVEETLKKVEDAEGLLAFEKISIQRVQNDSQILKTQAEMCTRLKDILIDRGNIIGSLQGEIAALSKEVLALGKEIDQGIPISSKLSLRAGSSSQVTKEGFPIIIPLRHIKGSEDWAHVQTMEESASWKEMMDRGIPMSSNLSLKKMSQGIPTSRDHSLEEIDRGTPMPRNLSFPKCGLLHLVEETFPYITPSSSSKHIADSGIRAQVQTVEESTYSDHIPPLRSQYFSPMASISCSDSLANGFHGILSSARSIEVMNEESSDGYGELSVRLLSEDWEAI